MPVAPPYPVLALLPVAVPPAPADGTAPEEPEVEVPPLLPEPLELFAELPSPALDAPPKLLERDALAAPPDALPPPFPALVELDRGPEADTPPAIPLAELDAA